MVGFFCFKFLLNPLRVTSNQRNWQDFFLQNFNFWMITLTKTPILPNCQVPNGFILYNCNLIIPINLICTRFWYREPKPRSSFGIGHNFFYLNLNFPPLSFPYFFSLKNACIKALFWKALNVYEKIISQLRTVCNVYNNDSGSKWQ